MSHHHETHPIVHCIHSTFPNWPSHRCDSVSRIVNECFDLVCKDFMPIPTKEKPTTERRIVDFNVLAEHFMAHNPCFPKDWVNIFVEKRKRGKRKKHVFARISATFAWANFVFAIPNHVYPAHAHIVWLQFQTCTLDGVGFGHGKERDENTCP